MAEVVIYTDGASRGNPGPGGYGVILMSGNHKKEIAAGYRMTTNNRMELLAVIAGLSALKGIGHNVQIYSDSKYVVDAIEKKWLMNWLKTGFKGKKNADLWTRFYAYYKLHHIKMIWVKGHHTNPFNNRCDLLATQAADNQKGNIDQGFESGLFN